MHEQENLVEPSWKLISRYYLSGDLALLIGFILIPGLWYFWTTDLTYKIIEISTIVVSLICLVIFLKLRTEFLRQIEKFHYVFTETGLVVNQAEKTGLLFIKPKQTTTTIAYTSIKKVYLWQNPFFFQKQRNIFIQFKTTDANLSISHFFFSINGLSQHLPGVWDNQLQIPCVSIENALVFEKKLTELCKGDLPEISYTIFPNPFFLKGTIGSKVVNVIIAFILVALVMFLTSH